MQQPKEQISAPSALSTINGVIAFVLEVALLVAAFFWGLRSFPAPWGIVVGIVLALAIAVFWTYFMAPKAKRRISWPRQPLLALLLFLLAGLGLILVGWVVLGWILMIVAILNAALSFYLQTKARPSKSAS